jgi:hypothetical protein
MLYRHVVCLAGLLAIVRCSEVQEARWGSITKIRLPGGGNVGLYQPKHPSPLVPTPS